MCNIPLLFRLVAIADSGILIALSLVVAAAGRSGNFLTAPALMGLAGLTLAGVITTLIFASRLAAACEDRCPAQTAKLLGDIAALITALASVAVLITLAAPLASIPFVGRMAIAGTFVALTSAGLFSRRLGGDLAALAACVSAPPSPLAVIVVVLNTLTVILIGALVITGLFGVIAPLPFLQR